ncbi:MAG: hypothetical protein RIS80_1035 [Actinomycetota bacterium]|jgi:hypothetical protein
MAQDVRVENLIESGSILDGSLAHAIELGAVARTGLGQTHAPIIAESSPKQPLENLIGAAERAICERLEQRLGELGLQLFEVEEVLNLDDFGRQTLQFVD